MNAELGFSEVLEFWFAEGMEVKWFAGGESFDQDLRERFLTLHTKVANGELNEWLTTRDGRLALVIIMDQFSRNLYRGQAKAFELDARALAVVKQTLRFGDDLWFKQNRPASWRAFLYMPFMHSEDFVEQQRCLDLFLTHGPAKNIPYTRDHLDVIYRFGRFPQRNIALGRKSTVEEEAFLQLGFGQW